MAGKGGKGPGQKEDHRGKKRGQVDEIDAEDNLSLLDDTEALEFVEFDPKVESTDSWDPPKGMASFLEKHF